MNIGYVNMLITRFSNLVISAGGLLLKFLVSKLCLLYCVIAQFFYLIMDYANFPLSISYLKIVGG